MDTKIFVGLLACVSPACGLPLSRSDGLRRLPRPPPLPCTRGRPQRIPLRPAPANSVPLLPPALPCRCAVACVGQFWPGKYPATAPVLVACVAAYSALSLVLTLLATHVEKEAIAFTRPPEGRGGAALAISSRMPRFQEHYTLRVGPKDGEGCAARSRSGLGWALGDRPPLLGTPCSRHPGRPARLPACLPGRGPRPASLPLG